jgi:Domain of unknown function (DUF397)
VDAHRLHRAQWRTSTHSGQNGSCVQVAANPPGIVAVRDSKDPDGPKLIATPGAWERFTARIKTAALT